jgi:hypothetical protein
MEMSDANNFPPVVVIEIDPQTPNCSCGRGPVSHEFHDEPTCDLCRAEYEQEMADLRAEYEDDTVWIARASKI